MLSVRQFRRYFLPSRTIWHYLARLFAIRFVVLSVGIAVALQGLDLMTQSDAILAVDGNGSAEIWRYIGLRFPDLLSRFLPFSALIAVLLTLAQLNQHSEVVVMKASGLSPHRILLPVGLACAVISVGHFLLDDRIVTDARSELEYWQRYDYAPDLPPPPDIADTTWFASNGASILVEAITRSGNRVVLDRVTIYDRDAAGILDSVTQADFALYTEGRWTLFAVRRFDVATMQLETEDTRAWDLNVSPERFFTLNIVPERETFSSLLDTIRQLEREGLPVTEMQVALLGKIAGPMGSMLMPLLGALAAFGVHRRGSLAMRVTVGMGFGFAYFVVENFMLAMGKFGTIPPVLAAFGPFLLFLRGGIAVLFLTEE